MESALALGQRFVEIGDQKCSHELVCVHLSRSRSLLCSSSVPATLTVLKLRQLSGVTAAGIYNVKR